MDCNMCRWVAGRPICAFTTFNVRICLTTCSNGITRSGSVSLSSLLSCQHYAALISSYVHCRCLVSSSISPPQLCSRKGASWHTLLSFFFPLTLCDDPSISSFISTWFKVGFPKVPSYYHLELPLFSSLSLRSPSLVHFFLS